MSVPAGFQPVRAVGVRGFARPEAVAWVEETLGRWGTMERAGRHTPDALEMRGRGVVRAVPAPDGDGRWVIRRYLRGGWISRIVHDRYLRRGPTRPAREARASEAARERGIPTPRVEAGLVYPTGMIWYRADLVTRFVPDAVDLADLLFGTRLPGSDEAPDEGQRARALAGAGKLAGQLARAGIYHPDLNAKNFLVTATGGALSVQVLDLDRARVSSRPVPVQPMAARLTRSLRKFETTTGKALGERGWAAFRDATGDVP